jgi:2'-5' RNA ligase
MVQSVELLPDAALDDAVRLEWQRLVDAGLPSQARHRGASNRPHVTLAVAHDPWPPPVEAALAASGGPLSLPLRLGGLLVFAHGARCVIARLVVPSAALLALHARIATAIGEAPGAVPHTAPGAWTPHVTLARGVPVAQLGAVVEALGAVPDLVGSGTGLRRWDGTARREWRL